MDLLWFFLGILIILCIGRYNESNKLFWVLLVSFVGSFAVATVVVKSSHSSKKTKQRVTQVCPTQAPNNASGIIPLADAMLGSTISEELKPVSKDTNIPELSLQCFNSPLVNSGIVYSPLKPPQLCLHFSTRHDIT